MATPRSGNHLKYRYGICLNDKCEKCKSKEVQQILAHKDFVCTNPECGKPLRECPPPPPPTPWVKIACIAIGVLVVLGVVWYFLSGDSSEKQVSEPETEVVKQTEAPDEAAEAARLDSLQKAEAEARRADSIRQKQIDDSIKAEKDKVDKQGKDKPTNGGGNTTAAMPKVPFGVYSGPANGLGGEIKVTKPYTLDLRNANHDVIELLPGDVIKNVQIKNGELRSGMWQRGSERRAFNR